MVDLHTKYVGLDLRSPIIAASSGITETVERMKRAEDRGIGAVVMKTLFEKEVTRIAPSPRFKVIHHNLGMDKTFSLYSYEQASEWGPERYGDEIVKAKKEISIPVIASINCVTDEGWVNYAKKMEEAGADALELNVSCPHSSITFSGDEVEKRILDIVKKVKSNVSLPVIPKLSPQLTTPLHMVKNLERIGINGIVLFNRLTGLEIDIEKEEPIMHKGYAGHGGPWAIQYALRWISEISHHVKIDISGSGGVGSGEDVVKYILCGATTIQVCTAIVMRGYEIITQFNKELGKFMTQKGYTEIEDFRGKVTKKILGTEEIDRVHRVKAWIDKDRCSGCSLCCKVCIYSAVKPEEGKYRILEICDGCGLCVEVCPKGAIRMVKK